MKKLTAVIAISVLIIFASLSPALAAVNGNVTFNGKKMVSDFRSDKIAASVADMQPGDSAEFTVTFKNAADFTTDWYMLNDVIDTLEELNGESTGGKDPQNGAYTYTLSYTSQGEGMPEVIFSNDSVGGDTPSNVPLKGLHQATSATSKYFFLTTLKPGQSGKVSLSVKLDGETDNNSYMDTDAKVKLSFAVEKTGTGGTPDTPKTGDVFNFLPLIMLIAAAVLLAIVFVKYRKDDKEGEDEK